MVHKAAGVSGTITNGFGELVVTCPKPVPEGHYVLRVEVGDREVSPDARTKLGIDRTMEFADGSQLWFSVDKTNEQIKTIRYWKYRDMRPICRKLSAYQIEDTTKKDAQPGGGK